MLFFLFREPLRDVAKGRTKLNEVLYRKLILQYMVFETFNLLTITDHHVTSIVYCLPLQSSFQIYTTFLLIRLLSQSEIAVEAKPKKLPDYGFDTQLKTALISPLVIGFCIFFSLSLSCILAFTMNILQRLSTLGVFKLKLSLI